MDGSVSRTGYSREAESGTAAMKCPIKGRMPSKVSFTWHYYEKVLNLSANFVVIVSVLYLMVLVYVAEMSKRC